MASDQAFKDEENAYEAVKKKLGAVATVFQKPAGADAGFPDFGFTVMLPSGKVDLHIEYKNSAAAQMGSMRDWVFDGNTFSSNDKNSEQKKDLLHIMNRTPEAIKNGKRLLNDLQSYITKDIKSISSGSLTVIKDQALRRAGLIAFSKGTKNYQIANITDSNLGNGIITHYKAKFNKVKQPGRAKAHILIIMIKEEIWYVDSVGVDTKMMKELANVLGVNAINKLSGLTANLEVRIQPRGLSNLNSTKPVSIDVMASFRLKGKPSGGVRVI